MYIYIYNYIKKMICHVKYCKFSNLKIFKNYSSHMIQIDLKRKDMKQCNNLRFSNKNGDSLSSPTF